MLCDLCPNVYLDTSSSNSWMRYEEAHLDLRTVFRRALDVAGPQRLLFGTDSSFFPRGWNAADLRNADQSALRNRRNRRSGAPDSPRQPGSLCFREMK